MKESYELLKVLHNKLKSFPFTEETKAELNQMNLIQIKLSCLDSRGNNEVSSAIVWSADVLHDLLNKKSVRNLDEVVSFVEYVLSKEKIFSTEDLSY